MTALSLFSGIGGLDIAAHAAGIETVGFCEIEPFAVKVLERRFPGVPIVDDVRKIRGCDWSVDVVHGGFPCQDLSCAGKQKGLEGERSGLWYEMLRVIAECRPRFVLAENVRGAINLALDTVYAGLVGEGYKVYPYVIPASAVGAPHQRERLFVVGVREDVADCASERLEGLWPAREQESEIHDGEIVPVCDSVRDGKLWPTPQQRDYRSGDEPDSIRATRKRELGWSINLNDAVKLWPTPTSTERSGINPNTGRGAGLTHAVSLWRTPDANCMRGPSSEERMEWKRENGMPISINDQVGKGSLNPAWVEILMGFPIGWTDIDCDEPEPWPGWPALMGERLWRTMDASDNCDRKLHCNSRGEPMLSGQTKLSDAGQYPYEPPRTVTGCLNRAKRLKCLGNAVVPAQARPFFEAIRQIHNFITCECFT